MAEIETFSELAFYGLDAASDAATIPPGFVAQADNAAFDLGTGAAALRTRPGFRAMLTAALAADIREAITLIRTDAGHEGERWALLVAGSSTTAKVYKWQKDTTTAPASITPGGVNFDARVTQFISFGTWIMITGATDGKLYRFRFPLANIEACATGGAALTQPTLSIASAGVTNIPIDALNIVGEWERDTIGTDIPSVPDSSFAGSTEDAPVSSGSPLSADWTVNGGTVETDKGAGIDSSNPTLLFARLDGAADSIITTGYLNNAIIANANGVGSPARYATVMQLEARYRETSAAQTVRATVILYDSAHAEISRQTQTLDGGSTADAETQACQFDFVGDVLATEPKYLKIQLRGGPLNAGGGAGAYVSQIAMNAQVEGISFSVTGEWTTISVLPLADGNTVYLGESRLTYDLAAQTDFDKTDRVVLPWRPIAEALVTTAPTVRLGLRTGTTDAAANSALGGVIEADGQQYLVFDLSGLAAADRQNIEYIDLYFEQHAIFADAIDREDSFALFAVGGLSAAGSLTPDEPVAWLYREVDATTGVSSPALAVPSAEVTPSEQKAVGKISITGGGTFPANSGKRVEFYRRGPLTAGRFRLVATIAPGADSNGGGLNVGLLSDGYFWDDSERTFYDSIPELGVFFGSVLMDHDSPPFSSTEPALAVGTKGPRLVVATGKRVYASQITTEDAAGLYWTMVVDATAANLPLQGWNKPLATATGVTLDSTLGQVPRILSQRTWTTIAYPGALYVLRGEEVTSFVFGRFTGDAGKGAISHRSCLVQDGELFWLASDGYRAWDGSGLDDTNPGPGTIRLASTRFQRLLNPRGAHDGAALSATVYGASSAFVGAQKLLLFTAKDSSSSANEAIYVADQRVATPTPGGAWTRWLKAMNGGFAWEGEDVIYSFDVGGMIYRLGYEYGDRATAAATVTAVALQIRSRRYTAGRAGLTAATFGAVVNTSSVNTALNFAVEGDSPTGDRHAWTRTLSTTGERTLRAKDVAGRCEGGGLSWEAGATTTDAVTVRAVALTAVVGAPLI
jgi:hypothetical protein